jgi:hypothetical protein
MRLSYDQPLPETVEWVAIDGECHGHCGPNMDCTGTTATSIPADVLALLDPCPTCRGLVIVCPLRHYPHTDECRRCPDCIKGRPAVHIDTPCWVCNGTGLAAKRALMDAPIIDCEHCYGKRRVVRTFTATDRGLVPVIDGLDPDMDGPHFRRWSALGKAITGEPTATGHNIEGLADGFTVHGLSASTTHALHITEVTP